MSLQLAIEPAAKAMLWLGPGEAFTPIEVDRVVLEAGEVLVAVELATICGSDLHTVAARRSSPHPGVLGHEAVGHVVAINGEVRDVAGVRLREGDRIVWSVCASCGQCDRCVAGLPQKCRTLRKYGHAEAEQEWMLHGTFASHVHLLAGTPIVVVHDELPAEALAPVGCAVATAAAAVAAAGELAGRRVSVRGAGIVGLAAIALAADRGATVSVVEPDAERRQRALVFGAAAALAPEDAAGQGLSDVAIEASGNHRSVAAAISGIEVGGTVVLVGSVFPSAAVALDPERVVRHMLTITGVHNYRAAALLEAAAFVTRSAASLPFAELVASSVRLRDLASGLDIAAQAAGQRIGVRP